MFIMDNEIKGNSNRTVEVYESNIGYFVEYVGDLDLEEVTVDTIKQYQRNLLERDFIGNSNNKPKKGKKLSRTTINTYMIHLRTFFIYLYDNGYTDIRYFDKIQVVKKPKILKEILTEEQIEDVLFTFSDCMLQIRNKCIFLLMVDSGLRLQEIINLKIPDIMFNSNMIKINDSKGNKDRYVPMSMASKKSLYKYITFYRVPDRLDITNVFLSKDNNVMSEKAVVSVIRRIKEKMGYKKFNPHMLRHTFATRYIINGGDMFSLQLILGHEDLSMCRKYVHLAKYYMTGDYSKISTADKIIKNNPKIKI